MAFRKHGRIAMALCIRIVDAGCVVERVAPHESIALSDESIKSRLDT